MDVHRLHFANKGNMFVERTDDSQKTKSGDLQSSIQVEKNLKESRKTVKLLCGPALRMFYNDVCGSLNSWPSI